MTSPCSVLIVSAELRVVVVERAVGLRPGTARLDPPGRHRRGRRSQEAVAGSSSQLPLWSVRRAPAAPRRPDPARGAGSLEAAAAFLASETNGARYRSSTSSTRRGPFDAVVMLCRVLGCSRAGYEVWARRASTWRQADQCPSTRICGDSTPRRAQPTGPREHARTDRLASGSVATASAD